MLTLIIFLCICIALLGIIFVFIWVKTDWKKIDANNSQFYDSDGNHVYYDRKVIQRNKNNMAKSRE